MLQHTAIRRVRCAHEVYPDYAQAVATAAAAGVEVLAYGCEVAVEEIRVATALPVELAVQGC